MTQATNLTSGVPQTPPFQTADAAALLRALVTGHLGSSAPAVITGAAPPANVGMWWKSVSSTRHELYYYDGGQSVLIGTLNPTTHVWVPASAREVVTADREYFVRTDGSDTNTGATNTPGGAFRTFQRAVDVVRETLDLAGRAVTIRAGHAGVFGGVTVKGPLVGARGPDALALVGDTTDPTRVVMQTADATSVMRGEDGAQFTVSGFRLTSTAGVLIDSLRFSSVMVQGPMDFGATGPAGDHLFARRMSYLGISGAYTISGGGRNHYRAANNSIVSAQPVTVTAVGTPTFSQAVIGLTAIAELILTPATFAGSINGPQYIIDTNSVLIAHGTVLPGSSPGALATGGQIQ